MAKLKLTYFDFHGGRGEPARIALSMGGIPFEDERVKGADWERRKPGTPFGALPLLEKDGEILAQSNAINRYVGRLTNLYPSDPWQAALCDDEASGDLRWAGPKSMIFTVSAAPIMMLAGFRSRCRMPRV